MYKKLQKKLTENLRNFKGTFNETIIQSKQENKSEWKNGNKNDRTNTPANREGKERKRRKSYLFEQSGLNSINDEKEVDVNAFKKGVQFIICRIEDKQNTYI